MPTKKKIIIRKIRRIKRRVVDSKKRSLAHFKLQFIILLLIMLLKGFAYYYVHRGLPEPEYPGPPVSTDPYNVVPIHDYPELKEKCCKLINSEWPRSEVARMRSLDSSKERLPTNLVLTKDDNNIVLGHLKITPVPADKKSCFIESVVVAKECRGQGIGTLIMRYAEFYVATNLKIRQVYLSTIGQERFYEKLGYCICEPISIYGNYTFGFSNTVHGTRKVYMKKVLY